MATIKTIEEKAKAYDVAIKALRSLFAEQAIKHCDRVYIKDITNIFPELKESKDENVDEKIRKALIKLVTNHASMDLFIEYDIHLYEALSWLEKQAEQKPILSMPVFKEGDILYNKDSFASDSIFIFKGISKTNVYLCYARLYGEKDFCVYSKENWDKGVGIYGGEFYPANHKQKELLFSKMEESGYRWNPDQKKMEKIEQKPAKWSEDKSKELSLSLQIQAYLNTASDELYAKGKPLYSEKRIEDIHKCMLMWQKLHNAYFYQKPAAWSEEDEEYMESLLDIINGTPSLTPSEVECHKDWLKSLKERYTWKPSEEQMKALKEAVDEHFDIDGGALWHLYEDLLKLMEK